MQEHDRQKDWEPYLLVEVEARWKKVKEATLFWPDASTAILMDYDIPHILGRLRELEEENKLLRGSAELGKEDLELLLKECKELKEENSRLQKVLEANGITYNDALIIGRHLDEMGEGVK